MFHYIYKVTFDDSSYYIGKHSTQKINDGYKGSGRALKEKYADDVPFSFDILSWHSSLDEVMEAEKLTIGNSWRDDPLCLNLIGGGFGGHLGTIQSSDHIKKRTSNKKHHPNQREIAARASKIAAAKRKGTKDSADTIEKRRQSLISYNKSLIDKSRPYKYKAVVCDGVEYESVKSVMDSYSVTRPTVINRIKSPSWNWSYK